MSWPPDKPPLTPRTMNSDVRFAPNYFRFAPKRVNILTEQFANLCKHSPSRFICHAKFTLKTFGRYARPSGCHQVGRIKPQLQGCSGFVANSVSGRVNVVAAVVTAIRLAARYTVMLSDLLAVLAECAIGIAMIHKPVKTGIIVRKLAVKISDGKLLHLNIFLPYEDIVSEHYLLSRDNYHMLYVVAQLTTLTVPSLSAQSGQYLRDSGLALLDAFETLTLSLDDLFGRSRKELLIAQ